MRGGSYRDYAAGLWRVYVVTGLRGVMYPGRDLPCEMWDQPGANAVVDDFGNLVVVGVWV